MFTIRYEMQANNQPRLDLAKAARLLAAGASVRDVALACGVTTQAIYKALKAGRLDQPEAEVVA